MIKLEHVVLASPEQMNFIIEGMRNPMNSWEKSDSKCCKDYETCRDCPWDGVGDCRNIDSFGEYSIGPNDHNLMQSLANSGTDHRKFMRMMPVYARITAPLYWWKEFDTYKVGTVANSCSTMHKIQEKEFTMEDFSTEHLDDVSISVLEDTINHLNDMRAWYNEMPVEDAFVAKKEKWWQMIQLLPSSYNQTRNVMLNYEVLANIYGSRRNHKLDEWREFCRWIETLPYSELFCGSESKRCAELGKAVGEGFRKGLGIKGD